MCATPLALVHISNLIENKSFSGNNTFYKPNKNNKSMKKITFLLSLLLASAGVTASAQSFTAKAFKSLGEAVTDVNALQDGAYYAFKCNSKGKFIKVENPDGNKHFANDNALTEDDATDALAVFKLHKVGDKFQFETALSGFYIPALSAGSPNASETPGTFTIGKTDLGNNTKTEADLFAITGDNNYGFDMQDGQFVGWNTGGDQAWYKIYPVTVAEDVTCYKISYSLKKGDEVVASGNDGWYKSGSTYNGKSFVKSSFYTIACKNQSMVVSETNQNFVYVASKTGTEPFTTGKWYRMQTRYNNAGYRDNSYITAGTFNGAAFVRGNGSKDMSTYADVVNGLWRFEESGLGVKLYNLGTGKYLRNGGVSTVDNDGTVFYVNEPGQTSNVQLTLTIDNGAYFGNHSSIYEGNGRNAAMSTWNSSDAAKKDDGSNFTIYDVDAETDFMASAKAALETTLTMNTADSKFVSNGVTTAYDAVKAKVASATTFVQLQALFNEAVSATPATTITPDETAYYRLKIADTYITTEGINVGKDGKLNTAYNANKNINRVVSRSDANSALVPQIWQFVKVGNSYALCNVNNHCRCAFFVNGNLDMPVDENYITATATIKPVLSTATNDNSLVSLTLTGADKVFGLRGIKDNQNVNRFIGTNIYSANDPANIWQIEKVTTVPVSITDAKYATVAFPFATKVTTNSVKAYYATGAADGMITLVEYPEGIIPANQGALLYNEAGATTANLEIVTTDKAVEGNKLMPATAKRTGFTANSTYVLAKNAANEAAFLKNGLTVVPANKAYIAAETIPADNNGSNVLNFNFGQVTGINGVVAADKAGVQYFDLQGRRVLYPAHGIFVTNTGKKVFVK